MTSPSPDTSDKADAASQPWVKIAGFGLVTLIVGLLGLAVSAQFDPIETPPTIPVAAPPSTLLAPSTTSTSIPASTSSTPGTGPNTTLTPPSDAALELDQTQINFGDGDTTRSIQLTNAGGVATDWEMSIPVEWVATSPSSGVLGPGESVAIEVRLDRATASEGDISETLQVSWNGSSSEISMTASNNVNPVLHNPTASPSSVQVDGGGSCSPTQATVSVRVRDASPLSTVVVRWAGQESQMIDVGNERWEGVVGPFPSAQQESVRIVAFDEHGNAGGAAIVIDVTPCP